MQVTAPKSVIRPDRVPTAAEKMMETNKPKEVGLKDLVHRVQGSIQKEKTDNQEEVYQFPDPEESMAMKELMNSISQSQQGLVIAEKIESGLFSIFEAVGIARSKKGVDPEKAREFRENIAKQAEEVNSKLKRMQLYRRLIEEAEKKEQITNESSNATDSFERYLQEGLDFLKQGQKKGTRQQLKEFDTKMKQKLEEIRRFKELLAQQVEEKAQAARDMMKKTKEQEMSNRETETPMEKVKAMAKDILNSLSDPSLLHENLSHIRTAFYLNDEDQKKEKPTKEIMI